MAPQYASICILSLYAFKHMYFGYWFFFCSFVSLINYLFFTSLVFLPFLWGCPQFFSLFTFQTWHQATPHILSLSFFKWVRSSSLKERHNFICRYLSLLYSTSCLCSKCKHKWWNQVSRKEFWGLYITVNRKRSEKKKKAVDAM